jgi:hypothetical protein
MIGILSRKVSGRFFAILEAGFTLTGVLGRVPGAAVRSFR